MKNKQENYTQELFEAILLLENKKEVERFMRDLCTPKEISNLSERWRVSKLLEKGDMSYREIHQETGVSLATITRIARFLRTESHHGYIAIINKIKKSKVKK